MPKYKKSWKKKLINNITSRRRNSSQEHLEEHRHQTGQVSQTSHSEDSFQEYLHENNQVSARPTRDAKVRCVQNMTIITQAERSYALDVSRERRQRDSRQRAAQKIPSKALSSRYLTQNCMLQTDLTRVSASDCNSKRNKEKTSNATVERRTCLSSSCSLLKCFQRTEESKRQWQSSSKEDRKIKEELDTEFTFKEEENVNKSCSLRDRLHFEMDIPDMEVKKEVIKKTEFAVKMVPEDDWQTEGCTVVNKTNEKTGSKSTKKVLNKHLEKIIDTQESVKIKDEIVTYIDEEKSYKHTSKDVNLYKDHDHLKFHIQKHHSGKLPTDKDYTCNFCNKGLSSRSSLQYHKHYSCQKNKDKIEPKINKMCICDVSLDTQESVKIKDEIVTYIDEEKSYKHTSKDVNLYKDHDHLKFHIQKHHSGKLPTDKDYTCNFCNKGLSSRSSLQYHKHYSCPKNKDQIKPKINKMCTCDVSLQSYKYRTSLNAHIMRRHTNNKLPVHKCNESGQKYLIKHNLQAKHLNIHPYKCKECKETFTWNSTRVEFHSIEDDWKTEGSTTVNKTNEKTDSKSTEKVSNKHLEKNIDTQESVKIKDEIDTDIDEENSYKHTSEDVNLYKDHVIKEEIVIGPEIVQNILPLNSIKIVIRKPEESKHKSDKKSHICDYCSKKFSSLEKMQEHLKKHDDENKNKCPVCGKSFSFISNMKRHMKIHTGNNMIGLGTNDLNFNRKDYLIFHIQKHHSGKLPTDKDYTCNFCNKGLASKHTLQYHEHYSCPKNKDKIKPKINKMYTCDVCLQSYKYRTSLCAHIMRRHTNNKLPVHECNECGQKYLKKHNLQCHMQAKHLNIHPYKCRECKETFTWNSTLVAHERKFHGRED